MSNNMPTLKLCMNNLRQKRNFAAISENGEKM